MSREDRVASQFTSMLLLKGQGDLSPGTCAQELAHYAMQYATALRVLRPQTL